LQDLRRKYGPDEDGVFATWERLARDVEDPEARDRRVAAWKGRVREISDRLAHAGADLTRRREVASKKLCGRVEKSLAELGMKGTRFAIDVRPRSTGTEFVHGSTRGLVGASGFDGVEFRLSANRGEEMRPLKAVASGGEISRVMLALKAVLEQTRGTATMVFDEVDAGVGGRVASKVAALLASLAEGRQVLCITHLAAIASRASVHWCVRKQEQDGRTISDVTAVTGEERVLEIARMLGGEATKGIAVDHARELLREGTP
jgi:DNA repair protein RecN (Recombination protein N)